MSMMTPPEDGAPREADTSTSGQDAFGAPNAPTVPNMPATPYGPGGPDGPMNYYGSSAGPTPNGPYGGYGVSERGQGGANPQWPGARYAGAADYANAVPERMPRANAAGMARRAKRWLIGSSVVGFLILAGLAAGNAVGVTAASGSSSATSSGEDGHSATNPKSNDDDNPFFGGQGSQSGNSNFGPATSQPPLGGSSVS